MPSSASAAVSTLDPASGAVMDERGPRTRGGAEDALALQRWLHGGAALGLPGRVLVFLSGLAMPLLFGTGLAAWLLRRRNRRRARRPAFIPGKPA
ncbi:PepSY domain-containing protein [Dankookia sp. P2]|uniref:PepSY domain-containing protein n=1 Tax=Dankookia sp. P2 TaxID=3423955 RepID=UPI003D674E93